MPPVGFAFETIRKILELGERMFSIRFNRWTIAAFAFTALAVPGPLAAQTPGHPADNSVQFPNSRDLKSLTMSGSYLAARHASVERDASSAATFYRSALRTDPKNNELLDRAFISSLADGDIDEAVKLADRILTMDKANRVARLVVGVRDLKQKKYPAAQLNINQSIRGPITDLVATLLSGWASYGAGDAKAAVANIDKLTGPEWYPIFKDLHTGMILEISGKDKDAGTRFERAYKLDDSMLRVSDAYARWLSRNKDGAAATGIYEAFDKKLPRHPLVQEGLRETKAGKKLPPLVDSAQAGAAEALYGIDATPGLTDKNTWVTYYYRGICEERSKQWSKAEADMRKALELQPEQPHVLNYLGYSWIDQGINLDEGMKMIRRAVDQRPDDGYIVDSLGWAFYRIGNFEDAVKNLERAIDLKPEDPTINDHLGDAYWRVGRTLEAKFQWAHARDLKPEAEELPKIEAKIANGLPEDTSSAASADKKKEDGKGG